MSNINDLCAKCHRGRWRHTNPRLPGCHVFVEPAPQPAPRGEYGFCKFVDGEMIECDGYGNEPGWRERNPPAPSGDEAKVREILGRLVRATWMEWARKQPAPKASWLVEWERLSEPDKEVDRLIGEALYAVGYGARTEANVLGHGPSSGTPGTGILGRCKDVRDVELIREAYAAGKADERDACVATAQEAQRLQAIRRHKSKLAMRAIGDLRDAIARRGSEGK